MINSWFPVRFKHPHGLYVFFLVISLGTTTLYAPR
jgi:hypothetical protein